MQKKIKTNFVACFQQHAKQTPTKLACIFVADGKNNNEQITFGELDQKASTIAVFLQTKKLQGKPILLIYPAGIDFLAAFLGCLYAGAIPIPIGHLEKLNSLIDNILIDIEIAGIFTTSSYLQKLQPYANKFFVIDSHEIHESVEDYQSVAIKKNQVAYLQYTSGSTSKAKATIITHENLTHNLFYTGKVWEYSKNSITLTWAPHSHIYGLVCGLLVPLYYQSTTIIMPPERFLQRPLNWLETISEFKVTHSGCPNFGYELCVREIQDKQIKNIDLSHWRVAVNGGERVNPETLQQFTQKFQSCGFAINKFSSAYGSTELSGTIAVSHPQQEFNYYKNYVSSGNLLPDLKAIIVDPITLTALSGDQIGEIWLRGPSLAKGYWNKAEENKTVFQAKLADSKEHYFRSGDLGFIWNNELFITGRLKEMITLYGKKYFPTDLENTTKQALADYSLGTCVVFSISTDQKEKVIFLQEIADNTDTATKHFYVQTIRNAITKHHGIYLDQVVLLQMSSLPKTGSGKLQRQLVKQKFLNNELLILQQGEIFTEISFLIAEVLRLNQSQINLKAALSEYNFDSLKVIQLITRINEKYYLSLAPTILFEYATLDEFIQDTFFSKITSKEKFIPDNRKSEDIAIIGMQGIFPGANDLTIFWENLISGKDVIEELPINRRDWFNYDGEIWGGFIENVAEFDAAFFNISPREAELMDPQQRLFLQIAWKTIEDAGYCSKSLTTNTGVFVGIFNHDYAELLQKNNIHDAYVATGTTHSIIANRVSYFLNLNGPSLSIDTACSSSLVAIHHAVQAIKNGDCEMAIAGGVNALLSSSIYQAANKAGMLSKAGRCKTFDKDADGYVRAEGVAAILLKPLSLAEKDGDHIYAIIKGTAVNHGGHVNAITVPNPIAQAQVIQLACKQAQVDLSTISYIETHGTGTSLGDPIEITGLKKAFAANTSTSHCGLGSVKTHIGHLEAAAGIAGLIKVILSMQHQQLPGNLHFQNLNPYIDLANTPFYLLNKTQDWQPLIDNAGQTIPRRAGISSFGYGGTNAHLILEEAPIKALKPNSNHHILIAISAKTEIALMQRLLDLYNWLIKNKEISLVDLSYTLNNGRDHFAKRCIFVISSIEELENSLKAVLEKKQIDNFIINSGSQEKSAIDSIYKEFYQKLISEIRTTDKNSLSYRTQLLALGNFYTAGYEVNWQQLHSANPTRLSLPTYPFAKDYYWIPTISVSNTTLTNSSVLDVIKNSVAKILKLNLNANHETISFTELGFDSISFTDLAKELEIQLNTPVSAALFYSYGTINKLANYLNDLNVPIKSIEVEVTPNISEPIAIIGIQAYLPQSKNLQDFWEHLKAGHDLVTEIQANRWNWQDYFGDSKLDHTKSNSKWGAFISDFDTFDAGFFNISTREANLMDPQHRLLMEVVWKSIEDAGYDPTDITLENTGLFVGVEFNEYQNLIKSQQKIFHGHIATGNSHALLANRISYFLNFKGPSEVIDTACSSSLVALHRAVKALQTRECRQAIASGVSLMIDPETMVITSQLGALSSDGHCKTFDESANGYVKGEGVVALLLKPLKLAEQDHDSIYGIIRGSTVGHGGKAQSLTAPNAISQSDLLCQTYNAANIDPRTITYIETHGTGTSLGDPIEIDGLKMAFAKLLKNEKFAEPFCGLGSVKTNIGHLEPASGLAGVIKILLAMQHQTVPPLLHFKKLNPYINLEQTPFYIAKDLKKWQRLKLNGSEVPLRAGVSSFGFGGTYAHVILEEKPNIKFKEEIKPYYLVTLSAKEPQSLTQKCVELAAWLNNKVSLASLSFTLNAGRTHFQYRKAYVVSSIDELLNALKGNSPAQKISSDLNRIADLYMSGQNIDWKQFYKNEIYTRQTGLPTYPFIKQRYWYDAEIQTLSNADVSLEINHDEFANTYLKNLFASKLKISTNTIDIDSTYEIYGVDSLLGLEITNQLEKDFAKIPKTILFEKNTLRELAKFLQENYSNVLDKLQGISSKSINSIEVQKNSHLTTTQVSNDESIAIIGLSGNFPLANNIDEFWKNLVSAKDCITEIPRERWDYTKNPVSVGGVEKYFKYGGFIADVDKFDPLFFNISPREATLMDPQERLFMQSAWSTLEDAGYTRESLKKLVNNEVGIFAGATYNYYPLYIAEEWQKNNKMPLDIQMFSIANRVSYFLNLKGPSYVIDTACSSSLAAIHLACESILRGECQMAITGGVNLSLHPSKYHFLGSYSLLSEEGRCASFAEGGSGYVPSEGVGSILLKPLSKAIQDNDRIYGVIKGSSMNHGGKTSGYTVPNPNAQAELIKNVLLKHKVHPETISYVEAHGTGTALGDPIEIRGLTNAFEEFTVKKQFCAIGSVKSNVGHLEAAAGISQLAKILLQLKHKKLVPSIHAEKLNSFIDFENTPFYVQRSLTDWDTKEFPRRAALSSFGAGGTNVHMIIEEFLSNTTEAQVPALPFIFLLSAINAERLREYTQNLYDFLIAQSDNHPKQWLCDFCYTLQIGREHFSDRLAILAESYQDLINKIQEYLSQASAAKQNIWTNTSMQLNTSNQTNVNELLDTNQYEKLIQLWISGTKISWERMYSELVYQPKRISLPTYPFSKRRCWISSSTELDKSMIFETPKFLNDWLYKLTWTPSSVENINSNEKVGQWLIFSDGQLDTYLQNELGPKNCILVHSEEDYLRLFLDLSKNELQGIIYLWPLNSQNKDHDNNQCLLRLFQSLIQTNSKQKLLFCLVSRYAHLINKEDKIEFWHSPLWALTRIFAAEQGDHNVLLIDLGSNENLDLDAKQIATELHQYKMEDNHVAYRKNQRYQLHLEKIQLSKKIINTPIPQAILITGGLGALGAEVAINFAQQGCKKMLLTGTTTLPDRSEWSSIIDPAFLEKIKIIEALEQYSVDVQYFAVDVTDKHQMQKIIKNTETNWKTSITGVFHLAGVTTDSITLEKMTTEILQQVLAVKTKGALILHEIFQDKKINYFVLFSSIAALPFFGMSGLSAYAMANAFLDSLAAFRHQQNLPALCINWAAWADKGMSHRYNHSKFLDAVGMSTIALNQGIEILNYLLNQSTCNIIVFKILWERFFLVNSAIKKLVLFSAFAPKNPEILTSEANTINLENIPIIIQETLASILEMQPSEINPDLPYENYGLDSIIGINFVSRLNSYFPNKISPMDLYRFPTVNQLAAYLASMYQTSHSKNFTTEDLNRLLEQEIAEANELFTE